MEAMRADEVPIKIAGDGVEVRMTEVGTMTMSFIRLAKGVDLGPALVGLPGDLCPCPHWGYMLEGKLRMRTRMGTSCTRQGRASTGPRAMHRSPTRTAPMSTSRRPKSSLRSSAHIQGG